MKKIISLILSVAMLACVAVPAFAATTYTWTLATAASYDGTGTVGELQAGDLFYLLVSSDKGYKGMSLLLDIDTDVFEIALYEGADDVADNGNYTTVAVMNPAVVNEDGSFATTKMDDKMSVTASTSAARPAAVNSYIGLQVKEGVTTGDYTIGVSTTNNGVYNKVAVQANDSVNVGNKVTVSVKGNDPAPTDPVTVSGGTAAVTGDKDDTKVWKVDVAGDKVAKGDILTATLSYNGDAQIVPLTVNVEGGADWSFNLRVRFKDCDTQEEMNAKRDATTLTVVKAAN